MKTKILLLLALLIVLVSVASASEVSNDTADIAYTDTVAQDTSTYVQDNVTVKSNENKEPLKEDNPENVDKYSRLVDAVEEAKQSSTEEYHIELTPGDYNATTSMIWGDATGISRKLIINGNGITLDGINAHQFIEIKEGYSLTLNNITLSNYTGQKGGAIYNNGNLTINNSNLNYNNATWGGAIRNYGNLTINNSNLNYNTASEGGAIYSYNGSVTISNTNLTQNTAKNGGSAINNQHSNINITNSNINYNNAIREGGAVTNWGSITLSNSNVTHNTGGSRGAISNEGNIIINNSNINYNNATLGGAINNRGSVMISNSNLTQNTATNNGGAIHNRGTLTITNSNINYNTATNDGGAINNNESYIIINDSNVTHNTATNNGGAINNQHGNINITNSKFNYNTASDGGAINNWDSVMIFNTNLTQNTATRGGAINNQHGNINITNSKFNYNTASDGGAIYSYNSSVTISNTNLTQNTATNNGGSIYNKDNINITNSNINYNTATNNGGAIHNRGTLTITNSNINYNTATNDGGSIYNKGNINITNSNINYNTATYGVGAIYNGCNVTINNSNITHNTGSYRGAIYNKGNIEVTNSIFADNNPGNFIIENHKIILDRNEGYITVGNVSVYLDNKDIPVYSGLLNDYTVPFGNHIIHLVVNGTDTYNLHNNTFILYSLDDVVTNYDQLVAAVEEAKESQNDEYYITLHSGNYNATTKIIWGDATGNTRKLIIKGNGITLNGINTHHFIEVREGYSLILENTIVSNYLSNIYGGAIYNNHGSVTISDSQFINNTAGLDGGAIYNKGNVTIYDSQFINNTAVLDGGAIYNQGNVTMSDSQFINNTPSNGFGGAIVNEGGSVTITKSNFLNNTAGTFGGAIVNLESSTIIITGSIFINNTANTFGGAIDNRANITISNSIFEMNTPPNFIIRNNKIILNHTDGYITVGTETSYVENNKIYYITNGTNTETFYNNTYILPKNDVNITYEAIEDATYQGNVTITGKLQETNGNPIQNATVKITINDQTYYNQTDNNGIYKLTSVANKIGENKVTIECYEDYYNNNAVKTTFNAKKDTKINITVNNTTPRVNDKVKITITLKDASNRALASQNVKLKINNKNHTLTTDSNGKASYTYTIIKSDNITNITATFESNDNYGSSNDSINLTRMYKGDMELLTGSFDTKPGDTVKLIAHIKDNGMDIDGGQLVFKLNGLSLKDEDGKVIKSNIKNGLAVLEYKIPDTLGARTHNLTAVYASSVYGRVELTTPMTINKVYTHIDVNPLYTTNNTIQIKAQIVDQNNQALNRETSVSIKISGKSYTLKTLNGTIDYTITQTLKNGYYNITITSGENGKYLSSTMKTVLIKTNTPIKTNYINNTLNNNSNAISGDTQTSNIMSILTGSSVVKPGDRLKLIAHISEDKLDVNGGQLVFKLNGVSLKDENGTVIKANIKDGLGILDYKIPDTLGARTHNLTAVYASSKYGRIELSTNLTMNKLNTHIDTEPIYTSSNTTYIKASILDDNNQLINKETSVVIKIDGKSYSLKTSNGTINYQVPTTLSKGLHQITIITGENGKYLSSRANTVLIRT